MKFKMQRGRVDGLDWESRRVGLDYTYLIATRIHFLLKNSRERKEVGSHHALEMGVKAQDRGKFINYITRDEDFSVVCVSVG